MTALQTFIFFILGMIALIKNCPVDAYIFIGLSVICGIISDILSTITKKGDNK